MKDRYRLIRYGHRSGTFYLHDNETGQRESLETKDRKQAERLIHARNEAVLLGRQNLQVARVYLSVADPQVKNRTWQVAMDEIIKGYSEGPTKRRWQIAVEQEVFDRLRNKVIVETVADDFKSVLNQGTVSTNVFLRRIHNFCLGMNWLPWPILPKKMWPAVHYGEKRAITWEEHSQIIAREANPERRDFYELCWHLGGSQTDIASLHGEDIDWENRTISYVRRKLRRRNTQPPLIRFGPEVAKILERLPKQGPLFPYLITVRAGDRATEFHQRCQGLGIKGVSLHSYRYAWAERARKAGYPERFAQEALGHNSKAVHRAYARQAKVNIPSLDEFEELQRKNKIIPLAFESFEAPPAAVSRK